MPQPSDIAAWRKGQRTALIARREQIDATRRHAWNEHMTGAIEAAFPLLARLAIGLCWPFRGEFDARFVARTFRDRGAVTALPAVVHKRGPLEFRKWWPGVKMSPGVYGIPVPEGSEVVAPDALLVPMNAFDDRGYRLGYGGGYFDRTIAALDPRPLTIGVTFEALRLPTIYPQPHDIPMDFVVTEEAVYRAGGEALGRLPAEECAERACTLVAERGLPRRRTRNEPERQQDP